VNKDKDMTKKQGGKGEEAEGILDLIYTLGVAHVAKETKRRNSSHGGKGCFIKP
jgi:hypothetical protein